MNESKVSRLTQLRYLAMMYLPYLISVFVIMIIGLSFIGNIFTISYIENEVLVIKEVSMANLLFSHDAGVPVEIFFIILYLVLPVFACVLLVFSRFHKFCVNGAMIIFLIIAVSSIVSKDAYLSAIYYFYKVNYGVKYAFVLEELSFSYFLIIIGYSVSFILTFIASLRHDTFSIQDMTEMGVLIAAAIGLNFIKIFPMPTGGSVNLQMLPLFFLALRRGPLKGFIGGGIVYGFITCLTDGWGFAPYPLDYLMGFGSIAVMGFFSPLVLVPYEKNYTLKGELFLLLAGSISTVVRFIAGTVSSIVIYGYDLLPAMAYNSLYIFISGALAVAILMALLGPIKRINTHFPVKQDALL